MELEIRESGTIRATVMAPIMAAVIAIDCTSAFLADTFLSCPAINRERPRKPSVAASRVLASARASSLPSAARTQPIAGWSLWLRDRYLSFCFQAEDGIRVLIVTGVQTCALPI